MHTYTFHSYSIRPLMGEYEKRQEMYIAQCNLAKRDIKQ
jgi:hypothetical protein